MPDPPQTPPSTPIASGRAPAPYVEEKSPGPWSDEAGARRTREAEDMPNRFHPEVPNVDSEVGMIRIQESSLSKPNPKPNPAVNRAYRHPRLLSYKAPFEGVLPITVGRVPSHQPQSKLTTARQQAADNALTQVIDSLLELFKSCIICLRNQEGSFENDPVAKSFVDWAATHALPQLCRSWASRTDPQKINICSLEGHTWLINKLQSDTPPFKTNQVQLNEFRVLLGARLMNSFAVSDSDSKRTGPCQRSDCHALLLGRPYRSRTMGTRRAPPWGQIIFPIINKASWSELRIGMLVEMRKRILEILPLVPPKIAQQPTIPEIRVSSRRSTNGTNSSQSLSPISAAQNLSDDSCVVALPHAQDNIAEASDNIMHNDKIRLQIAEHRAVTWFAFVEDCEHNILFKSANLRRQHSVSDPTLPIRFPSIRPAQTTNPLQFPWQPDKSRSSVPASAAQELPAHTNSNQSNYQRASAKLVPDAMEAAEKTVQARRTRSRIS